MQKLDLQKYLINDRQWLRVHRIAHAKAMLARTDRPTEKDFWHDVIDANTTKDHG